MKQCLLSVCLITYNHEKYIREAIDSVLMQNVNFDWELIIADDCSTDNTRNILLEYKEKYPDFINLILQEKNVGPAKNWEDLITYPKSKYIAYFEGDDYWTDPLKLQKQVDFLEANPDYSFSFHDCTILHESKKKQGLRIGERKIDETPDLKSVIISNNMPTASLVFRTMDWDKLPKWFFEISKGDYGLVILLAEKGRGKYFHEPMSVYRVHDGGVWSSQNIEYVYNQDIFFYDHLLNYFEDLEVKNTVRQKINFTKANNGIFLMRNGELLKGLLKVIVYNNWFGFNSKKVSYRKVLSSIKQGCQNKIKMI